MKAVDPEQGELRPTDVVGSFFLAGLAMLLAAALAAAVDAAVAWEDGRWLALHLAFVGGVSQLVLGASQFFAGAFLATDPPSRRSVRSQLALWNVGAALLAVAVTAGADRLVELAVAMLLAALAVYAAALQRMMRRSLQRAPMATRWYLAAAALFAPGILAGLVLANGWAWSHGDLLAAHLTLNLAGWFGTAIVGTVHTFYPSLTRTRLAHPRLELPTLAAWCAGVAFLAIGFAFDLAPVSLAGWALLAGAAGALGVNVAASTAGAPRPLSLPARLLGIAQAMLAAGVAVALTAAIVAGPAQVLFGTSRAVIASLLVGGWIAITVLGSLVHLLFVVVRVRDLSRSPEPPGAIVDRAVPPLAAASVIALAAGHAAGSGGLIAAATVAMLVTLALLGGRVLRLAIALLGPARPRV